MSPEELELEKQKALALEANIPEEEEEEQVEPSYKAETGSFEAMARSAAQVTMFDFADEAEAFVDTAFDVFSDEDLELSDWKSVSAQYGKNLDIAREEFKQNAEAHPTADKIGLGVGIGASLLTGSATAKGLSKLAPGMMRGFNALSTSQKAIRLGAFQGALSGVGITEDKLSLDSLWNAAKGAAFGGAAGKAGSAIAESNAMKVAGEYLEEGIQKSKALTTMAMRGIGLNTPRVRSKFFDKLRSKGVKPEKWLDDISAERMVEIDDAGNFIEGDLILDDLTASYDDLWARSDDKIAAYGRQRDAILGRTSKKFDRQDVANIIKSRVVKDLSAEQAQVANQAIDDLIINKAVLDEKTGNVIRGLNEEPLDLLGISSLRRSLDDTINFNSVANANKVKRSIRGALNDFTDDVAETVLEDSDKLSNRVIRKRMSNLYSLQEALEQGANESFFSTKNLFNDFLAGRLGKAILAGPTGINPTAIEAASVGLRRASTSSKLSRKMAAKAYQLADALPNASEKAVRRLVVAANGDDLQLFDEAAAGLISQVDLQKMPLTRSSEDAFMRKDTILPIVQQMDQDLASSLREGFESKDPQAVAPILDMVSKHPEMRGLVDQGLGWDGKVYTEEDKAILEEQLKGNSEISLAQRLGHLDALRQEGIIPQVQPDPKPPLQHIPRRKDRHEY